MFFNLKNITLILKSGKGGRGIFLKEKKYKILKSGKGGRGGRIFLFFDKFLKETDYYFFKNKYFSENGKNAKSISENGKNGKDLILRLPYSYFKSLNFKKNNLKILFLKGGKGGRPSNIKNFNIGKIGFLNSIILDFKIIFNFFLIGLSNTGKSTFFSKFFNLRKNRISVYKFTTVKFFFLKFKLKNKNNYIIDSLGSIKKLIFNFSFFLKKIIFKIFFHFLNISNNIYNIIENFKFFNKSLYNFKKDFFYKPRFIIFNKIDLLKFIYFSKKNINKFFLKIFNWNYLFFFNTYFFNKKFFFKIIKYF